MKKRTVVFVSFLAGFVLAGIGFSLYAVAGTTRITPSGKVGIGTLSPETQLHVVGSDSANVVTIEKGPQGLLMQAFDGVFSLIGWGLSYDTGRKGFKNLALRANAKPTGVYIETSGKVGINTWAPEATLHVNGSLKVTGNMSFPKPAYKSAWTYIPKGQYHKFVHGLGGDPENYFVHLTCRKPPPDGNSKITNMGVGFDRINDDLSSGHGAYYYGLDNGVVYVRRGGADWSCQEVRVRMW